MTPQDDRPQAPALAEVIAMGLRALRDLTDLPSGVTSGDLEHVLRVAAARHETSCAPPSGDTAVPRPLENAAVAVRTACAHLSAGDLPDTYLALCTARDALPRELLRPLRVEQHGAPDQGSPGDAQLRRAGAVAGTRRRALGERAAVEQAAGVLAQHADTSVDEALALLHAHAERHQFVLAELAADVVAGRVDSTAVTGAPAGSGRRPREPVGDRSV